MDFKAFAEALAGDYRTETYSVRDALSLYDVLKNSLNPRPDFPVHEDQYTNVLVQRAAANPRVMASIDVRPEDRRKIQAIKDLREYSKAVTGATPGLKECKDAIDFICAELDIRRLRDKLLG